MARMRCSSAACGVLTVVLCAVDPWRRGDDMLRLPQLQYYHFVVLSVHQSSGISRQRWKVGWIPIGGSLRCLFFSSQERRVTKSGDSRRHV